MKGEIPEQKNFPALRANANKNNFLKGKMTMNKRILSIILVLTMLVGVVAVMPMTATAAPSEVWDGSVATSFAGGDGSEDSPYQIANGAQLALLADLVTNKKDGNYNRAHYVLTADIVLNDMPHVSTWYDGWLNGADDAYEPENMITPIGTWSTATSSFGGTFDGQGHTITGAYFYAESGDNHGLFGAIQGGAVIKNFALVNSLFGNEGGNIAAIAGTTDRSDEGEILIENVYVDAYVYSGGANAGGILGTLSNSQTGYAAGSITVSRVTFNGLVQGTNYVGGIIADARNVIFYVVDCLVLATIKATNGQYSAGFVARSKNNLELISEYDQVVTNCILASGSVTATKSTKYNRAYISSSNGTSKPLSEYNLDAVGISDVRNADDETSSDIAQITLYGYYDGENAIDWDEWDANAYYDEEYETAWAHPDYDIARPMGVAENFDLIPVEPPKQFANGSGTEEDPYLISDAEQLAILSQLSQTDSFAETYFQLTADITLEGENNVTPIGGWASAFGGTFDGDGHTISGMHIKNSGDGSGFFACIQGGATIKNLALVDAHVESTSKGAVGALVGQTNRGNENDITIENVYVDADVIVANGDEVAGVIGNLSNSENGYEGGAVLMDNVVFTGSVTASTGYVAGLVGNARNIHVEMTNCANYGTIKAGGQYAAGLIVGQAGGYYIADCVSAGKVTGTKDVYAIACHNNNTIYNDTGRGIEGAYYVKGIAANGETKGAEEGAVIVALKDMSALLGANANAPESFATRVGDVAVPADCTVLPADKVIYGIGLINGASVRLSSPTGIRFTAILGADYLNSFDGDVSFGIIIAPTDYVQKAGEFTVEALAALGYDVTHKEIKADKYVNEDPASDGYYEFTGVLAPIQEGNYERAFSARAYVKVGNTYYYSEYDESLNSRSIAVVAERAYNDLAVGKSEDYPYMVVEDVYTPYSASQRNTLLGFLGKTATDIYALSYNVRAAQDEKGFEKDGREDDVVSYLKNSGADVIGLQEVNVRKSDGILGSWFGFADYNWLDELSALEAAGYACYTGKNLYPSSESQERYLPIYYKTSRFELVYGDTKWLTDTPDSVSKLSAAEENQDGYRGVTYVILKDRVTGARFVYANVHNSPSLNGSIEGMKQQIVYLREILEGITEEYDAMFIGGDNNYGHTNIEKFYNKNVIEDSVAVEKSEVVAETEIVSVRKSNPVYNNDNEIKGSGATDFEAIGSSIIDNFFIANTGNVTAYSYKLVDNKVEGKSYNYPSDHIPVKMYVSIYTE